MPDMRVNRYYLLALAVSLAALFSVRLYLEADDPELAERVLVVGFCAVLFTLGILAWRGARKSGFDAVAAETERLRRSGMLDSRSHRISRAFHVAESAVEGPHYFLEIEDGRVLYLAGQYLYQEDGEGLFPAARITIVRHKKHGYVVDLVCDGGHVALAADLPAAPRAWEPYADGDMLDTPFDELLADCGLAAQKDGSDMTADTNKTAGS